MISEEKKVKLEKSGFITTTIEDFLDIKQIDLDNWQGLDKAYELYGTQYKGLPQSDLEKMSKNELVFAILRCAKEWGISLSDFLALPTEDRTMMLAHSIVMAKIREYWELS